MSWEVTDSREIAPPGGADATVWSWTLKKGDQTRTVEVFVSGTAMSSSTVPAVVEDARETRGGSAVADVLEWEQPPTRIRFNTDSVKPLVEGGEPGAEIRELTEIVDWFQERGLYFMFAKRGSGTDEAFHGWHTHTAHLIDPKEDKLLGSFEAPTRLEAVRAARDAWTGVQAVAPSANATTPAPSLTIDTERDPLDLEPPGGGGFKFGVVA
jgi:hypothetical protein